MNLSAPLARAAMAVVSLGLLASSAHARNEKFLQPVYDDVDALPASDQAKERYRHFLTLPSPRAFVLFEDGRWRFYDKDPDAMVRALDYCARLGKRCWLYAANDRVVWSPDVSKRISSSAQLEGGPAAAAVVDEHQ